MKWQSAQITKCYQVNVTSLSFVKNCLEEMYKAIVESRPLATIKRKLSHTVCQNNMGHGQKRKLSQIN